VEIQLGIQDSTISEESDTEGHAPHVIINLTGITSGYTP
jgi:hypothetical protein